MTVRTSCYAVAFRLREIRERDGAKHHPFIQWALSLTGYGHDAADEVPWCAAFVSAVAFLLGLPYSRSAAARSWLNHGQAIKLEEAEPGNDIVILKRGRGLQPGPEVTSGAPGHVGFFAGSGPDGRVMLLGGNQSDAVTTQGFDRADVLGVRRLA
jgi:uncharacterized protein (TIGR02594 family)